MQLLPGHHCFVCSSPGSKQSLVALACVDISAVSNRLCRTASSGHLKINYQTTVKRNSCTVTEYEKSRKRMLLEREKNIFFYTKLFPSKCQSIQNWELAGASSTQQFSVGCLGESGFGAGWVGRLEILLCVLMILNRTSSFWTAKYGSWYVTNGKVCNKYT